MIVLAQTVTATDYTQLTLAAVLAGVCLFWPWTHCRKCEGAGRFRSPSGKNWRPCPRCKGSGRKERLGARILDRVRAKK